MKGFYHLAELQAAEIEKLVVRALHLRSGASARRFDGKALGILFFNPSLRTQASFQRAAGCGSGCPRPSSAPLPRPRHTTNNSALGVTRFGDAATSPPAVPRRADRLSTPIS